MGVVCLEPPPPPPPPPPACWATSSPADRTRCVPTQLAARRSPLGSVDLPPFALEPNARWNPGAFPPASPVLTRALSVARRRRTFTAAGGSPRHQATLRRGPPRTVRTRLCLFSRYLSLSVVSLSQELPQPADARVCPAGACVRTEAGSPRSGSPRAGRALKASTTHNRDPNDGLKQDTPRRSRAAQSYVRPPRRLRPCSPTNPQSVLACVTLMRGCWMVSRTTGSRRGPWNLRASWCRHRRGRTRREARRASARDRRASGGAATRQDSASQGCPASMEPMGPRQTVARGSEPHTKWTTPTA